MEEFLIECEAIIKDHQGISNPQLGHKDGDPWQCCQIKKTQMYKRFKKKKKKKLVKRNKRAFLFKLYAYVDYVEEKRFLNLFKLTHIQREKKKKTSDDHFIGILKFRDILEREGKRGKWLTKLKIVCTFIYLQCGASTKSQELF